MKQGFIHLITMLLVACWLQSAAAAQTIIEAVKQGDAVFVERMLHMDPELANVIGVDGMTPLHWAAWNGNAEIVSMLIAAGARLNQHRSSDGFTPLFCATYQGHADCARLLIEHGALVDARDNIGNTPLAFATADGHFDVAKVLIASGADVNARREPLDGWTALFSAVHHDRVDTTTLLLQHGADPEIMAHDGSKAIDIGAQHGTLHSVAVLLDYGQNIDTPDRDGDTPLGVAARNGQLAMVKFLIGAGANLHARDKAGHTPLEIAQQAGKKDIAETITLYQNALAERAARDAARKASGITIRGGYLNWAEPNVQPRSIYSSDFLSGRVGREWSTSPLPGAQHAPLHVSTTPIGSRRFLGDFGSQAVRLTLTHLPAHREVSLYFDLFIIRSWDGNNLNAGPDIWYLRQVDGPTLLYTTFGNTWPGTTKSLKLQAYPGEYAGDHYALQTGAVETNTLGYTMSVDGRTVPIDSVYKLSYTFPHTGAALLLDFAASGLEPLDNESWGITNVQVSVAVPTSAPVHRIVAARSVHTFARPIRTVLRRLVTRGRVTAHATSTRRSAETAQNRPHGQAKRLHPIEKPPTP